MDDVAAPSVPRHVIDSLDQSVRDIESENVENAQSVQAEARRMLADYERARPAPSRPALRSKSTGNC